MIISIIIILMIIIITRVEMYVCFGFSIARLSRQGQSTCNVSRSLSVELLHRSMCLSCMSVSRLSACFRRARTIDLQWQSLSLRRAFLLRSVCLSVRLTVESRPVCWPTHSKNQSKNTAKIDRRSIPGDAPGHPKSTQNRSRDHLGRPRVVQERPEGVSGASRERHRASPALSRRARRVTKGDPARQKERPGALGSALRRQKSMPSRVREWKNRVFLARRVREASSERFFVNSRRFSVFP